MDLTTLSAGKLAALYDKRLAALSTTNRKLIDAGYGNEKCLDTRKRAELTRDPLAVEYVERSDAFHRVVREQDARRRWHGSLKPIRRAS